MDHDSYTTAFQAAAYKSAKWELIRSPSLPPSPDEGRAIEWLPLVQRLVDSSAVPVDLQQIRVSCGQIHTWLFKNLRAQGARCILTVGDVQIAGRREYGASYQRLKQELRGVYRASRDAYPFHVWLTFPDLHIIDANFYIYRHHDSLPDRWRWSEYVICSEHQLADALDIAYVPMLVGGDDLVERMIFA